MRTVVCLLRAGGIYDPSWVDRLSRAVDRHLAPDRFVCMTDMEGVPDAIPLVHRFPGWWAKVEAFRPGLFDGRVIYLDLDTLLVGDCRALWSYGGRFAALRDFKHPAIRASGVLAWDANAVDLYTPAVERLALPRKMRGNRFMQQSIRMDPWWNELEPTPDVLQDLYPGLIAHIDTQRLHESPGEYRMICLHGKPKIEGWVAEAWEA